AEEKLVVEVLWATEYSSGRESASVSTTDSRASAGGAPAPRGPAARTAPRTMFEKIWARHVVAEGPGGHVLLYIDRHLLHEGTTAAFNLLPPTRARGPPAAARGGPGGPIPPERRPITTC